MSQSVAVAGQADPGYEPPPPYTQSFEVRGPRYTLDPQLVCQVYPRPGSLGSVADVLPHAALSLSTLPWARPVKDTDPHIPWLALLTFADGELTVDPATGQTVSTRDIAKLADPEPGVLVPHLAPETMPADTTTCRTIDVPAPLFTALTPRLAELRHLVHVKHVDAVTTWSGRNATDLEIEEPEPAEVAVVLSNRLPRAGSGHGGGFSVHLVSVEGFADHLDGKPVPVPFTRVRMISLYSWTFTAQGEVHPDFADEAENLKTGSGTDLLLRAQPRTSNTRSGNESGEAGGAEADGGDGTYLKDRLAQGYVPVAHHLPTGERTVAWYRGPWTPVTPHQVPYPDDGPATEADALVYLPEHGMFDVSHASAFSLGRTLALSSDDLPTRLSRMRADGVLLAQEITAAGGPDAAGPLLDLLAGADPDEDGRTVPPDVLNRLRAAHRVHRAFEESLHTPAPGSPRDTAASAAPGVGLRAVVESSALSPAGQLLDLLVESHLGPIRRAGLDANTLLASVPFDHLVPHAALLPPDSVRFFTLDTQWLHVMAAGAASVGRSTSLDTRLTARLITRLRERADPPSYGALIRSPLVRDWPTLTVTATGRDGRDVLHGPPQSLTPDLMLLSFREAPAQVALREPAEGIRFGVDGDHTIELRRLKDSGPSKQVGMSIDCTADITSCLRDATRGVLTIWTDPDTGGPCLNRVLRDKLAHFSEPQWDSGSDLTAAALSVQLLNGPHQLVFTATSSASIGEDGARDLREPSR
ncbi:hypothetical protein [Streptomyces tsukubensis]|uniref:hypothetical protein n=1 Tax=Streptomyces tsukubensis TaxID=83656 RepID=UPI00117D491C|nr:hypothetical protein [Streptomyces tsukubensis]QFR96684.1 hypothetical protein GBW32_31195 [Streptomyces tsukubensis]